MALEGRGGHMHAPGAPPASATYAIEMTLINIVTKSGKGRARRQYVSNSSIPACKLKLDLLEVLSVSA